MNDTLLKLAQAALATLMLIGGQEAQAQITHMGACTAAEIASVNPTYATGTAGGETFCGIPPRLLMDAPPSKNLNVGSDHSIDPSAKIPNSSVNLEQIKR